MSRNFAICGIAGYIAPRHLQAIKETGNRLVAALDPHDSVGILDSYFPEAEFFTTFEVFDRHLEKLRRLGPERKVHYLSICSPNYLHDAHIRTAFRVQADAICEKPMVLSPWNLDALEELEREYGHAAYCILQLRLHASLKELKTRLESERRDGKYEVTLTYITSRGAWYRTSWKNRVEQSGGLATNIGIHFFDMLIWLFGEVQHSEVHANGEERAAGFLELKNARVRWLLSIDANDLPERCKESGIRTHRSILMNDQEIEFSTGFTDLHTESYRDVLSGGGFRIPEARPSIELTHSIRTATLKSSAENAHPLLQGA